MSADARLVGLFALYADRAWCLKPESMDVLLAALENGVVAAADLPAERPQTRKNKSVAIVPLHGMIRPTGATGLIEMLMGAGGGLDEFRANLRMAVADPSVSRVVLDVNSPGGLVDQVPETAAEVRRLREQKPITAVANTQAASAAYWIASQADELITTPSGELGSIGAFSLHTDKSGALEKEGLDVTVMSAGRYKSEGNPYGPLDDEAREARQAKVDRYYEMFVRDVSQGRRTSPDEVRGGYGEGRTLIAEDAVTAGLADGVGTLHDVVGHALQAGTDEPQRQQITAESASAMAAAAMDLGLIVAKPSVSPEADASDGAHRLEHDDQSSERAAR
jgi:signal peptide peptidase SppA